jgi:hypothetical protein
VNKRTYTAEFLVGARLMGTFKGAMSTAQARLQGLAVTAKGVGLAISSAFTGVLGVLALISTYALGKAFSAIFKDAQEQMELADQNARRMAVSFMNLRVIANKGFDFALKEQSLVEDQLKLMAKRQFYGEQMLETIASTGAAAGIPPKTLVKTTERMADVLAVSKGVKATQEDAVGLTMAWDKAIRGGMVRGLAKYLIFLGDIDKKAWKAMTPAQKNAEILLRTTHMQGASAKLMKEDVAQAGLLNREIEEMSKRIGFAVLPAQAEANRRWREMIPAIEPVLRRIAQMRANMKLWAAEQTGKFLDRLEKPPTVAAWNQMGTALNGIARALGIPVAKGGIGDWLGRMVAEEIQKDSEALTHVAINLTNIKLSLAHFFIPLKVGWDLFWPEFKEQWAQFYSFFSDKTVTDGIQKIGDMFVQAWQHPLDAIFDRWQDIRVLAGQGLGTPSAASLMVPPPSAAAGAAPPPSAAAGAAAAAGATTGAAGAVGGYPVTVASYGGPSEPGQKVGAYGNRLGAGDVAISPNLYGVFGKPAPDNYVMLDGQRYHVADSSWYHPGAPTSNMVEIWGYGNQIKRKGALAKAYAYGGVIRRATQALLGERGPEMVLPLRGGRRSESLLSYAAKAMGMTPGPTAGVTSVSFAPVITIHGGATDGQQAALDRRLRDLAREFIERFKQAQAHERRLSYEGGYS